MKLIPFAKLKFKTDISEATILNRIRQNTLSKDWKITFNKMANNSVFESDISNGVFIVVSNRFALTYGKTSLLPRMYGKIERNEKDERNVIKILIRPSGTGILILTVAYLLALTGIRIGLQKNDMKLIFFMISFVGVTYLSVILKYNSGFKDYIAFIKNKILFDNLNQG